MSSDTLMPGFQVPAGFVLVKRGGRPKKISRDAAVFLAKFWRTQKFSETAAQAENWIVTAWEKIGKYESKGIGEAAHVRAAIKRAKNSGLERCFLKIGEDDICTAVENSQSRPTIEEGARVWLWREGMPNAIEAKVANLKIEIERQPLQKSAVAAAVGALSARQFR